MRIVKLRPDCDVRFCRRRHRNLTKAVIPATPVGTRNPVFELGLGPVALALCGPSGPTSRTRIDAVLAACGSGPFVDPGLRAAGLEWAADLAGDFQSS